jgi:hypothetical protein
VIGVTEKVYLNVSVPVKPSLGVYLIWSGLLSAIPLTTVTVPPPEGVVRPESVYLIM